MALKINYQAELNEEQFRAVKEGDGPCLILAGAGSGKTRTIIYRLAYLLEQGIKPQNILLVTFTNKAAKVMLERATALLGSEPTGLWGGTFHHLAAKILRHYAPLLGYTANFGIADEDDAISLLKQAVRDLGFEDNKGKTWPTPRVIKGILSYAKNTDTGLAEVLATKYQQFQKYEAELELVREAYEKKKQSANVFDFDDLLVYWLRLLTTQPQVKEKLSGQFQYILVDEYQDTNFLQAEIIRELSTVHNNVFVVGDDAQSIYSFRGADINNILNFPKIFKGAKIFKLETNYRSTPEILSLANSIIKRNSGQHAKTLRSPLESFEKPQAVSLTSPAGEASFIVDHLQNLYYSGISWGKMAVLFRATHHSQALEFELSRRGIAYEYRGGLRFFERAHVKDILAFLRLINNPVDEASWLRLLNSQTGIGPATAGKIFSLLKERPTSLAQALEIISHQNLSPKILAGWNDLKKMLSSAIDKPDTAGMIGSIMQAGYRDYLRSSYLDWEDRLGDLQQIGKIAGSFKGLTEFLEAASLEESFATGTNNRPTSERLVLSTIHQAKGLEWEAVFVMNLADKAFPHQRSVLEGAVEEERRLFYVAVTRAIKYLFLTYPSSGRWGEDNLILPSIFLREIEAELLAEDEVSEDFTPRVFGKLPNDGEIHYLPDV